MVSLSSVDEYIASAPAEIQAKLEQIRMTIKNTVPEAQERMSYGMPYYSYKGRLAYFGFAKNHIGLYMPTPIVQEHKDELRAYETAAATIRFPLGQKLPLGLIKKLVKARAIKNEQAKSGKAC